MEDITINIASSNEQWAYEIRGSYFVAHMGAGSKPGSSPIDLLLIALTAAFNSIAKSSVNRILVSLGEYETANDANIKGRKLRVLVQTKCRSLVPLLKSPETIRGDDAMRRQLLKGLNRFNVTVSNVENDDLSRVRTWLYKIYPAADDVDTIRPDAVRSSHFSARP